MTSQFDAAQIEVLRSECAKIDRINPSSPTYRRMIALLNDMDQSMLKQIRDAKIKFLSRLAINRIVEEAA